MKIGDVFGGDYLKVSDLQGRTVRLQISHIEPKEFKNDDGGMDRKLVFSFTKGDKQFVANLTNCLAIAQDLGEETDQWIGHYIDLYPTKVQFGKKMVDAIRCRVYFAPQSPMPQPNNGHLVAGGHHMPAPAPHYQPAPQMTPNQPPFAPVDAVPAMGDAIEDEIPW